jgi:hypothetical protein
LEVAGESAEGWGTMSAGIRAFRRGVTAVGGDRTVPSWMRHAVLGTACSPRAPVLSGFPSRMLSRGPDRWATLLSTDPVCTVSAFFTYPYFLFLKTRDADAAFQNKDLHQDCVPGTALGVPSTARNRSRNCAVRSQDCVDNRSYNSVDKYRLPPGYPQPASTIR